MRNSRIEGAFGLEVKVIVEVEVGDGVVVENVVVIEFVADIEIDERVIVGLNFPYYSHYYFHY